MDLQPCFLWCGVLIKGLGWADVEDGWMDGWEMTDE